MLKKKITKIFQIFIIGVLFLHISGCNKHDEQNFASDVDGNEYGTVAIGDQVWMNANLKTTRYNDGTEIPNVSSDSVWVNLSSGAYCWQSNDINNKNPYGALYNWYAVNTGKLCPAGWHVASDQDWFELALYLGGDYIAGGKIKVSGTNYWAEPNNGATNETGFNAMPGGSRYVGKVMVNGAFYGFGSGGLWCSSTEYSLSHAYSVNLSFRSSQLANYHDDKRCGFSIRCIRD